MDANTVNALPHYFLGSQFTARVGEAERKLAADYIAARFPDGKLPETTRDFLKAVLSNKRESGIGEAIATSQIVRLRSELAYAKAEIEKLKAAAPAPVENFDTQLNGPVFNKLDVGFDFIDFSILEDERLKGFEAFRKPEHTHPFDTIKYLKDEADKSIIDYERAKFELEQQPLRALDPEEYEFHVKWKNEVFLPAMRALTGRPELEISGRHLYMMLLDYAVADPLSQVFTLLSEIPLTDIQKAEIINMQFPRESCVVQVLADIDEKAQLKANDTTQPVLPVEEPQTTEGAKVIDINANRATETTADPARSPDHTDGPE